MNKTQGKRIGRYRRMARVRRKARGTDACPRVSVFRSNHYLYVQLISDESGRTLASASTLKEGGKGVTLDKAKSLGSKVSELCRELGIDRVVFDRAGYRYHGRIKALADAAREGGLKF